MDYLVVKRHLNPENTSVKASGYFTNNSVFVLFLLLELKMVSPFFPF